MNVLKIALSCLILLLIIAPTSAAQSIFNNFVTLGFQAGVQEYQSDWIGYFQLFSDLGPEHSAQLRLAVRSGLFNGVIPTMFLTNVILNIGTGFQRFYIGAGFGVPMNSIGNSGSSLQATALIGLRAPPVPGVIAALEGGMIAPFEFDERPSFFMSFGVAFPL